MQTDLGRGGPEGVKERMKSVKRNSENCTFHLTNVFIGSYHLHSYDLVYIVQTRELYVE